MIIPRRFTWVPLASVIALVTFCGTLAAFATRTNVPAPTATESTTQSGMNVTGFDAAVAKAHGYKIVTYADGSQQSVPVDPNSNLPKSPILYPAQRRGITLDSNTDYNQVQGNCGISWIRVSQTGTHQVAVVSGFKNAPLTAIDWSWTVSLSDKNGTSYQTAGGLIFNTAASRIWTNLNQYSFTFDYVYSGVAELIDGAICTSGAPDVAINL